MKKKRKINVFVLLRLLGIALFIYIVSKFDIGSILSALENINPSLFILGILFQFLVLVFKGIRWHLMNDGRKRGRYWVRSFGRFFESYAIGVVTPGRLGELIKVGHEENRNDRVSTFFRIVSERGFDVSIFVLFGVAGLFFGSFIEMESWLKYLFLFAGLFLLILSWMILTSPLMVMWLQFIISKLPGKLSAARIEKKQMKKGVVSLLFLLSVFGSFSHFISCYFLAGSVGLDIPFLVVGGGVVIAGLLNMLPVTVLGMGTRELIFLSVFSDYSKTLVMAFSISILLVAQIGGGVVSMLLGQLFIYFDKRNSKPVKSDIR